MGFNPLELSRDVPIEGYHTTFKQIAIATDASPNGTLLNPIVGPEPITGSTRMKSGSATKILLEVLFHAARLVLEENYDIPTAIVIMLRAYEDAVRDTYLQIDSIAELVEAGGNALRKKGHIYYIGAVGENPEGCFQLPPDVGVLGLIDASECPPTYGASFEDVRGFVNEGWTSLVGYMPDFVSRGTHYQFSFDDFRAQKLDSLSSHDLVVFLGDFEKRAGLMKEVAAKGAQTASIMWHEPDQSPPTCDSLAISLPIPHDDLLGWGPTQLGVKLVINALTTGAHIIAGKVYSNRMVDLGISNNKLFFRTVGIISDLIGVNEEQATDALLKSIFETDTLTDSHREAAISACIERARSVNKVVPKALLLATGRVTLAEATAALQRDPIVRTALGHYVQNQ
jgi:N-acetylmuramic acid 6-phosphate (MurNAc-6-P) etherase